MSALVQFRNVSFAVVERSILKSVSLSVEQGETMVLLGRSGSGKTTLLKMVNRLIEPTGGTVFFQGQPASEFDVIRLRRMIGYVIQDAGLFPHVTVARNVGLVPELEGWPADKIKRRTDELLEMAGLTPSIYAARYPGKLSGGEKQRVGIARALAADPVLLLFDEPFSALDPVTRFEMQKQFLQLRDRLRKTALFVTHDIREAMMLGHRIAVLRNGEVELVTESAKFASASTSEAKAFLATLDLEPYAGS